MTSISTTGWRISGSRSGRIILGMYGICVVLSLIALSIIWSQGRTIPIAIGAVFILAIFALRYLQYVRSFTNVGGQMAAFARRRTIRYALLQAQILDLEVDRCTEQTEILPIFNQSLRRVGFLERGGLGPRRRRFASRSSTTARGPGRCTRRGTWGRRRNGIASRIASAPST